MISLSETIRALEARGWTRKDIVRAAKTLRERYTTLTLEGALKMLLEDTTEESVYALGAGGTAMLEAELIRLRADLASAQAALDATRRMQATIADAGTRTVGEVLHLERELAQARSAVEAERAARMRAEADASALREAAHQLWIACYSAYDAMDAYSKHGMFAATRPVLREAIAAYDALPADHPGVALLAELARLREALALYANGDAEGPLVARAALAAEGE